MFLIFYAFICDFLVLPLVKTSGKFSQPITSRGTNESQTQKNVGFIEAGFSIFANVCLLRGKKTGLKDFSEKRAPTKVKYLLPFTAAKFYGISPKETRENSQSVFAFLCSS